MRIHLFARRYPVPYKPYYDAQFAAFVAAGHDVRIFASGTHDSVRNEKVATWRLTERTSYFPATIRQIPACSWRMAQGVIATRGRALQAAPDGAGREHGRRRLIRAARILSVARERPDLCFIHGLGTAVMLPWLGRLYPSAPIALYYHGGEVPSGEELEAGEAATAFAAVDVVFTNTEFSRQHAIDRGCVPEKTVILPVGFDLADFEPPANRAYRRDGTLRLLSAGRMSEEKGFIHALQALNRLVRSGMTNVHYSLTGEGYLRPSLEAYVRAEGLEPYVSFLGTLTTAGVIRAMAETDVLLLPSIQVGNWVENQACAVQEAMLMKALVVVSRTGGVPESVAPEMSSYIVPPGDSDALADAIAAIHALPVAELQRLGTAGRAFVSAGYDVRRLNDRIIELSTAAHARRGRLSAAQPFQDFAHGGTRVAQPENFTA